jgi:hypothetical protein
MSAPDPACARSLHQEKAPPSPAGQVFQEHQLDAALVRATTMLPLNAGCNSSLIRIGRDTDPNWPEPAGGRIAPSDATRNAI